VTVSTPHPRPEARPIAAEPGTSLLNQNPGFRFLVLAAALVVFLAGLRAGAPIIVPFLLAVLLAILNLPLLLRLRGLRIPTPLAIVITVAANAAILGTLALILTRSFEELVVVLPRYIAALQGMAASGLDWLEQRGIGATQWVSADLINVGAVIDFVGGTLRGIATVVTTAFIVLLLMIFVLSEATDFPTKLRAALGRHDADLSRLARIMRDIQRYLGIKTLISLVTGVLIGTWVWILGIDFPLLWGLVAFLFNYIPNVGSILASVPPFLLTLVQFGPGRAILLLAGYVAVNVSLGNFVEPRVMGRQFGLSTLVVVLSLIFWGWLWGVIGMLLAVPLTMVVRIILEHTRDFRWVAVLLSGNVPERDRA
jgi:AI-2 transport protein TqsA